MNRLPFFADIPAEEYHQAARDGKFLSSHLLGDFRKCPRLYVKKMNGEIEPIESAALAIGRAVHVLVLEGRAKFDEEFLISDGPVNPKTGEVFGKLTKAYKEWLAAQRLPVVSGADFNFMSKLQQSVWTHPAAAALLDDGVAEQTVRTNYCGEPCQIRMDWFRADYDGRPAISDLKTCETLDWFESDARRFGYPAQAAFYREVLRTASSGEVVADCYLIAVEKREPFRCGVWKLTDGILESCGVENERAIAELRECRKSNTWPTRTEDMRILDV
ncbi:MAG: PD-(D/E)XK nuclease-like domain-containing protein [Kiritimatiellae bacterium]|nr:PD-(D/E)XK nuclease-like domain-containing protein [Kiritimatiellia bacterium]